MTTYDFHGATLAENLSRECGHARLREADSGCELCDIDWLLETDNVSPNRDEGLEAARRRMLDMRAEVVTTLKKRRAS